MPSRQEVEDSFEAVPAYIVADKRDQFGRRLGRAAFVILILFFVVSGYIQSARNGAQLDEARTQRAKLIASQERVSKTLEGQGALIVQLQAVITRQNEALRKAGLPVEPVPDLQELIDQALHPSPSPSADPNSSGQENRSSAPRSSPASRPRASSAPRPRPSSSPRPRPRPSPSPSPTRDPVTQTVCNTTGICL